LFLLMPKWIFTGLASIVRDDLELIGSSVGISNLVQLSLALRVSAGQQLPASQYFGKMKGISRCILFDLLATTATLQHGPARPAPPPGESTGAPNSRQAPMVDTTSSLSRGITSPIGTWR
jgi:hypothetical protein